MSYDLNRRILSLLLAVIMLFSFVGCAADNESAGEGQQTTAEESTSFLMDAEYTILRGDFYRNSGDIGSAVQYIKEALSKACGLKSTIDTDSAPVTEDRYEIIIGDTSREESKAAKKDLEINDYTYYVKSEKLIVICGGSSAATLEATKKFCADILGYEGSAPKTAEPKTVKVGESYTFRDDYAYESVSIGGIDIKDFVIAYSDAKVLDIAEKVVNMLGSYTGDILPMVKYSDLTGEEKGVICINAKDRNGKIEAALQVIGYKILPPKKDGDKVTYSIIASSGDYYAKAIKDLMDKSEGVRNDKTMQLSLLDEQMVDYELNYDIPTWNLKSTSGVKQVADGVTYTAYYYQDDEGLPYRAYVMTIDPTKAYLYMGTASDSYEYIPSSKGNVMDHIDAAVANGVNVVGGVNGDYFHISSDYSPLGLAVKESKVIYVSGRPYCGFTEDGRMVIGENGANAELSKLRTSVGGSHVIVKDSMPYNLAMDQEHGYTSHPRTLAGYKSDGTMILAVIDGRMKSTSNGATLAECARFMLSLGAECAINLDGGGSSTMIIKNGSIFSLKNRPCYGYRKVYSSLLVVSKSEE